jgi:soluble lytic murein transglycosylase
MAPDPAKAAPGAPAAALGKAYRAYERGDFEQARNIAKKIPRRALLNDDYALYVLAQSSALLGEHKTALASFRRLGAMKSSRFAATARWRIADSLWATGQLSKAAARYRKLIKVAAKHGDVGLARYRIAEQLARSGNKKAALQRFRAFARRHPAHVLGADALRRTRELGGDQATRLTAADHIVRARRLVAAHQWRESVRELSLVPDTVPAATRVERDYWLATTLFKMRRDYKRAGDILLGLYKKLPKSRQAEALFHGARALSRADFDAQAITWYLRVVKEYPRSRWAVEAHYLAGWLQYNLGKYPEAIKILTAMGKRHPKSRWADDALWFTAYSHYLLGQHDKALPLLARLSKINSRFVGGKGRYWHARSLQKLGKSKRAIKEYRALVRYYPMSWYALLARARIAEAGQKVPLFGSSPRHDPARAPAIAKKVPGPRSRLARDELIRRADELLAAKLSVEAGVELRRGEKPFLRRFKGSRGEAFAILLDRYRRADNFTRPWMLSIVYGGRRALDAPPKGKARVWWKHCYPLAYKELVDEHANLGKNPRYYLYSIMRQESGFDPHVISYANAIGLVQMIPRTTKKVVKELGLRYTSDMLWDPALNLKTGSWYIGRLLHKFKDQIPYGAGSFNSGPKPVMRWMDKNGKRPADEFVELVSYSQTREYMKRVTEHYARYLYLYEGKVYEQPLTVDPNYVHDNLTY